YEGALLLVIMKEGCTLWIRLSKTQTGGWWSSELCLFSFLPVPFTHGPFLTTGLCSKPVGLLKWSTAQRRSLVVFRQRLLVSRLL
ncbi:MAG: hypothetical protein ACFN0V_08050, partial [Limosilactobacillus fermentum]